MYVCARMCILHVLYTIQILFLDPQTWASLRLRFQREYVPGLRDVYEVKGTNDTWSTCPTQRMCHYSDEVAIYRS